MEGEGLLLWRAKGDNVHTVTLGIKEALGWDLEEAIMKVRGSGGEGIDACLDVAQCCVWMSRRFEGCGRFQNTQRTWHR